jgi:glycosyltransferase involved in cell wall biosynthesis
MLTPPFASVVVPAYNSEKTVAETLRSLLRQTFTNLEVVVVDDGSTDGTASVVESFSDGRVRLVRQRNRGLAGAHNTGVHNARGRYIGFCDADDLWLPEKLELHVAHLESHPEVGISFSGSQLIDEAGDPIGVSQRPRLRDITAAHIFKRNPIGNGSSAVIRRKALDDLAYRPVGEQDRDWWFDETFRQSDDIEAWTRFALTLDWRIEGIPGLLTQYRIHQGALSANIERQYETWRRMVAKIAFISPEFVRRHGRLAAAYQLRYLARRAVSMRSGPAAADLSRRALRSSVRLLIEEPTKTLVTLCAAEALNLFGSDVYARAERMALGAKTA